MSVDMNGQVYEFGPFSLDTQERVLMRDGRPLPLKPKVYETLLVLVSKSGHIVDKEDLMKKVWPDVSVEENNLTGNIFALRRVFDDCDYIETVPRRGYRFTADVRQVTIDDIQMSNAAASVIIKETINTNRQAIDSLAVLPFVNAGADPEMEYLSDGITESIINNLSQLPSLKVVARNTVFRYKGREVDVVDVARELNIGAVLTGRVLRFADRLIIRAELVDAADGWQLWGAQYNRETSDIFAVQEQIAKEISESLRLKLTGREQQLLEKRHTENTTAYYAYLKGRYYENRRTEEGLKRGMEYFQQAIDEDPCYALAYSGLADCYSVLGTFGGLEPKLAFPKAKAAATKALEIDTDLAEAHTSLAFVKQLYDWDWSQAQDEYARAAELNPGYATTYFWRATLFAALGRRVESIAEIQRALELDPLSLPINTYLGWALYFARRYDEAISQYQQTLEVDKSFVQVRWRFGIALAQQREFTAAKNQLRTALEISEDNPLILAALGYVCAVAADRNEAENMLRRLRELSKTRHVSAYHSALIQTGLQNFPEALTLLERAYEERFGLMIYLGVEPVFDPLQREQKFTELLQRIGFSDR